MSNEQDQLTLEASANMTGDSMILSTESKVYTLFTPVRKLPVLAGELD